MVRTRTCMASSCLVLTFSLPHGAPCRKAVAPHRFPCSSRSFCYRWIHRAVCMNGCMHHGAFVATFPFTVFSSLTNVRVYLPVLRFYLFLNFYYILWWGMCGCKGQNLQESILSFHCLGPREGFKSPGLNDKYLYPLTQSPAPFLLFKPWWNISNKVTV